MCDIFRGTRATSKPNAHGIYDVLFRGETPTGLLRRRWWSVAAIAAATSWEAARAKSALGREALFHIPSATCSGSPERPPKQPERVSWGPVDTNQFNLSRNLTELTGNGNQARPSLRALEVYHSNRGRSLSVGSPQAAELKKRLHESNADPPVSLTAEISRVSLWGA